MDTLTQYDIIKAAKIMCEFSGNAAPNWLRMLAGASDECLTNPMLFDALIDEVRSAMEVTPDERPNSTETPN